MDFSGLACDDIRHAEGQRQRGHKGFAAGQCPDIPYPVIDHAVYVQIQSHFALPSQIFQIPALQEKLAAAHADQALIGCGDNLFKIPPLHIGLEINPGLSGHLTVCRLA